MAYYPKDGYARDVGDFEEPSLVKTVEVAEVDALGALVAGTATTTALATALASQINSYSSSPNYTAEATSSTVVVIAPSAGVEYNGKELAVQAFGDVVIEDVLSMAGGTDPAFLPDTEPGQFVKTFGAKMYTTSGPALHFSGIGRPTVFNTEAVGAGFIDLTTYASGADTLLALENYFGRMAVFARDTIQIWSLDPDPDRNQQEQVIRNSGTIAPHSAIQVGEVDLFFLSDTGIMTLRPHGVTTEARVEDASLPISDIVQEAIAENSTLAERAIGIIEPQTKSFWLAIGDQIFVLSRYPGSKIAAWSVYEVGGGTIDDMLTFDGSVYIRQGNTIKQYGGADGTVYDSSPVTVRTPYMDAQRPADWKMWDELNIAAEGGTWEVTIYTDPDSVSEEDAPVDIDGVSYGKRRTPLQANSTHLSLKLVHEAAGYARISNLSVHYESSENG